MPRPVKAKSRSNNSDNNNSGQLRLGADNDIMRRLILWGIQGLVTAGLIVLWSELKDLKAEQARVAGIQSARGERFVQLESKSERYGSDISEIRQSIRQIESSVNNLTLSLEKRR